VTRDASPMSIEKRQRIGERTTIPTTPNAVHDTKNEQAVEINVFVCDECNYNRNLSIVFPCGERRVMCASCIGTHLRALYPPCENWLLVWESSWFLAKHWMIQRRLRHCLYSDRASFLAEFMNPETHGFPVTTRPLAVSWYALDARNCEVGWDEPSRIQQCMEVCRSGEHPGVREEFDHPDRHQGRLSGHDGPSSHMPPPPPPPLAHGFDYVSCRTDDILGDIEGAYERTVSTLRVLHIPRLSDHDYRRSRIGKLQQQQHELKSKLRLLSNWDVDARDARAFARRINSRPELISLIFSFIRPNSLFVIDPSEARRQWQITNYSL